MVDTTCCLYCLCFRFTRASPLSYWTSGFSLDGWDCTTDHSYDTYGVGWILDMIINPPVRNHVLYIYVGYCNVTRLYGMRDRLRKLGFEVSIYHIVGLGDCPRLHIGRPGHKVIVGWEDINRCIDEAEVEHGS